MPSCFLTERTSRDSRSRLSILRSCRPCAPISRGPFRQKARRHRREDAPASPGCSLFPDQRLQGAGGRDREFSISDPLARCRTLRGMTEEECRSKGIEVFSCFHPVSEAVGFYRKLKQ